MKIWKMLVAVGSIALLVACSSQPSEGVGQEDKQDEKIIEPNLSLQNEDVNAAEVEQEGARIYVNQTDAWSVELPKTWATVKIVENSRSTDFIFPSENEETNQSLLYITAVSEQDWEKDQANGPLGTRKEITRVNGHVYTFQTPLDMVLEGEELALYEKMSVAIPQIVASFEFE